MTYNGFMEDINIGGDYMELGYKFGLKIEGTGMMFFLDVQLVQLQ